MKVQIAGYTPHKLTDITGRLICLWTQSRYSHVELVIDGLCYSSSIRDGGVRAKAIDLNKPWWDVIAADWVDAEWAMSVFERTDGTGYGYWDLLTQHVLRLPVRDRGYLCSEWVAEACDLPNPSYWTPGQLFGYALRRRDEMRTA